MKSILKNWSLVCGLEVVTRVWGKARELTLLLCTNMGRFNLKVG